MFQAGVSEFPQERQNGRGLFLIQLHISRVFFIRERRYPDLLTHSRLDGIDRFESSNEDTKRLHLFVLGDLIEVTILTPPQAVLAQLPTCEDVQVLDLFFVTPPDEMAEL